MAVNESKYKLTEDGRKALKNSERMENRDEASWGWLRIGGEREREGGGEC